MLSAIALMQALVPGMMDRGWGRVVNITSASVRSPVSVLGLSNTARTGLTGFVAGMSRQVAGHGVCVNNILPGPIEGTEGLRRLYEARGQEEHERDRMALGHFGETDDIALSCAFLASPAGDFITGCDMTVDGGRWLKRAWV